MAEQIPHGVATSLIDTLASLAFREIASIYGVESDIEWLKNTVEDIKAVLSDADHKQHSDQLVQRWISKLKQVLYEADDLLDEIHTQHLLRMRDAKGKVRDFFSSFNPIAFRLKISHQIRNIRERFNAVAENMSKLNLHPRVVHEMKHGKSNWRETSSFVTQGDIVGREGNKNDIIELLLNHNNGDENLSSSLVAIVGIGGLGKTALAQLVYNNAEVERSFDKRMWVCVSQDFDVKAIVKQILESLLDKKEEDQPLQLLQNKLQRNLDGQKFLLVLDDVWNEDREKWFDLEKYLICGAEGSKILLTTRNQAVANKMGVKTPYLLKGLENDQSWTLLKRLAFDKDQKIMTQNLESIGQKIAEKCAGVPLAIRAMGSLLQSKSKGSDWKAILEADFWEFCEDKDSIMPILKLSYDSLAIELKQCFAYCSLYPKDWKYKKDELIDLWMAQGFLGNEDNKQCPEDVGEEYVRILLMKSFLQDVYMDGLGEIKSFKMHDLMHEMSQLIASFDYCPYVERRKHAVRGLIHASFEEYNFDASLNMLGSCRLRTFLEIKEKGRKNPINLFLFKHLRSLDLSYYKMTNLPESIGKMCHLRYLNLSGCSQLTCLPKSISNLVNLQTLRLEECVNLKFSGDIIPKLINLRRLDIKGCKAFENGIPIGLARMTALQNLSHFIVGNDDKEIKKAKLNELKELNLRGRLTIQKLESVRDVEEESKDVNLKTKKNLISLILKWGKPFEIKNNDDVQLLENLRPHQNLKALSIVGYPGFCLSNWLLSCTNLIELKFSGIRNCQSLVALEGLVSLKTLHIQYMDKLEYIYYKECSLSTSFFPSLKELKIWWCGSLRGWLCEANLQNRSDHEWHHSLPPFSRLSSLKIHGCPNLSCMPTFPNLMKHLELTDSSTKPLLDTLSSSSSGDDDDMGASLSMLKSLHIEGIDIEALPEEWMQNLSSLKQLSIARFSSLKKPFCHMRNLSATLEEFTIRYLHSRYGDVDYNIRCQDLCCLHSLQKIEFISCDHLMALPEWISDLHSLRFIRIQFCGNLESFPEGMCYLTNLQTLQLGGVPLLKERCKRETGAEWPKISHIPNIWMDLHQI